MEASTAEPALFDPGLGLSEGEDQDLFSKPTLGDISELPCGYLDETSTLHRDIVIEEITGVDEDVLANEKLSREGVTMDRVMANTIARLGPIENPMNPETGYRTNMKAMEKAVKGLKAGDRYFILLKLRVLSLKPMFEAKVTCPRCSHPDDMGIDLNSLGIKVMTDDDAAKPVFSGKSSFGDTFKFKILTGEGEKLLQRIRKEKKEDLTTALLFIKLVELNDAKPSMKALKLMSSQRRNAIRMATLGVEGGIETELDAKCAECDFGWKLELPIGQKGFFFPSGI